MNSIKLRILAIVFVTSFLAFTGTINADDHEESTDMKIARAITVGHVGITDKVACMHGSVWKGDGTALLRAFSDRLSDE